MSDRDKVALRFIDTNEEIINTKEYGPCNILITEEGSILMSFDKEELKKGQAEFSLTFTELELIYERMKAKVG